MNEKMSRQYLKYQGIACKNDRLYLILLILLNLVEYAYDARNNQVLK